MNVYQTINASPLSSSQSKLDRLFAVARKNTVIQLRWPLVILSAYLLLYSPGEWLSPLHTEALVVFYLITNTTLYFLNDSRFESPYFYGPLLLFDTVFLAFVLGISGTTTSEFYIACFFTLVLSLICNDARGLLLLTILSPVLYAYIVFQSDTPLRPDIYLRLPFPLVIAIFYGYFAQVERLRQAAKINHERLSREHTAADELRRQRERLEVLHQVNWAATGNSDSPKTLETFLEKALIHLPYAAALVRLRNQHSGIIETAASVGFLSRKLDDSSLSLQPLDDVLSGPAPFIIEDMFDGPHIECVDFFRDEGLVASLGVPIAANGEALGSLTFFMRSQYHFSDEEKDFISTLAGQLAMAIQHARLLVRLESRVNQLHDSNRIKDDILRVISSELKTPLKTITGYTKMLIEGSLGQITPIQEKALQTIVSHSKDLNAIVGSVLQVSSIQSNVLKAEPHQTNFWEFMYDLRSSYDSATAKEVTVLWDFSPDLPSVDVDRGKLKQILQELIDNALVFTERGRVTVSARYLANEKRMEMKVTDTGPGICSDNQQVIFEKFRQRETSEIEGDRGAGLGLYIVKKLVELLNGSIVLDSRVGEGSTFTLRIPCEQVSAPASSPMIPFAMQTEPDARAV